jgi:hypothetical protein
MSSITTTGSAARFEPSIAAASLAGFIGLALALAVGAAMILNSAPAPVIDDGYRDFGLRHPSTQVAPERYPDMGLRHPATQVAPERYPDMGLRHRAVVPGTAPAGTSDNAAANDKDDYGLRCVVNGWCSQPWTSNGHR